LILWALNLETLETLETRDRLFLTTPQNYQIQFFLSHGKTSNFLLAEFLQSSLAVQCSLCLRSDDKVVLVLMEMKGDSILSFPTFLAKNNNTKSIGLPKADY